MSSAGKGTWRPQTLPIPIRASDVRERRGHSQEPAGDCRPAAAAGASAASSASETTGCRPRGRDAPLTVLAEQEGAALSSTTATPCAVLEGCTPNSMAFAIEAQSAVASALPPDQRRAFAGAVVASVAAPAAAGPSWATPKRHPASEVRCPEAQVSFSFSDSAEVKRLGFGETPLKQMPTHTPVSKLEASPTVGPSPGRARQGSKTSRSLGFGVISQDKSTSKCEGQVSSSARVLEAADSFGPPLPCRTDFMSLDTDPAVISLEERQVVSQAQRPSAGGPSRNIVRMTQQRSRRASGASRGASHSPPPMRSHGAAASSGQGLWRAPGARRSSPPASARATRPTTPSASAPPRSPSPSTHCAPRRVSPHAARRASAPRPTSPAAPRPTSPAAPRPTSPAAPVAAQLLVKSASARVVAVPQPLSAPSTPTEATPQPSSRASAPPAPRVGARALLEAEADFTRVAAAPAPRVGAPPRVTAARTALSPPPALTIAVRVVARGHEVTSTTPTSTDKERGCLVKAAPASFGGA